MYQEKLEWRKGKFLSWWVKRVMGRTIGDAPGKFYVDSNRLYEARIMEILVRKSFVSL